MEKPHRLSDGCPEATEQFVLLSDFDDDRQRDIVLALLKENGIPAFSRDNGAGGYVRIVTGSSVFGSRIYVPVSCQRQAAELCDGVLLQGQPAYDAQALDCAYDAYMQEKNNAAEPEHSIKLLLGFLLVFGTMLAAGLFYLLLK